MLCIEGEECARKQGKFVQSPSVTKDICYVKQNKQAKTNKQTEKVKRTIDSKGGE